jgi:hypothetical protein
LKIGWVHTTPARKNPAALTGYSESIDVPEAARKGNDHVAAASGKRRIA